MSIPSLSENRKDKIKRICEGLGSVAKFEGHSLLVSPIVLDSQVDDVIRIRDEVADIFVNIDNKVISDKSFVRLCEIFKTYPEYWSKINSIYDKFVFAPSSSRTEDIPKNFIDFCVDDLNKQINLDFDAYSAMDKDTYHPASGAGAFLEDDIDYTPEPSNHRQAAGAFSENYNDYKPQSEVSNNRKRAVALFGLELDPYTFDESYDFLLVDKEHDYTRAITYYPLHLINHIVALNFYDDPNVKALGEKISAIEDPEVKIDSFLSVCSQFRRLYQKRDKTIPESDFLTSFLKDRIKEIEEKGRLGPGHRLKRSYKNFGVQQSNDGAPPPRKRKREAYVRIPFESRKKAVDLFGFKLEIDTDNKGRYLLKDEKGNQHSIAPDPLAFINYIISLNLYDDPEVRTVSSKVAGIEDFTKRTEFFLSICSQYRRKRLNKPTDISDQEFFSSFLKNYALSKQRINSASLPLLKTDVSLVEEAVEGLMSLMESGNGRSVATPSETYDASFTSDEEDENSGQAKRMPTTSDVSMKDEILKFGDEDNSFGIEIDKKEADRIYGDAKQNQDQKESDEVESPKDQIVETEADENEDLGGYEVDFTEDTDIEIEAIDTAVEDEHKVTAENSNTGFSISNAISGAVKRVKDNCSIM